MTRSAASPVTGVTTPSRCRVCGCTHDAPCALPHGDTCMLSIPTGLCTNPRCVRAAQAEARAIKRRRRDELAALVRPVLESFRRQWARNRRPGQPKRSKSSPTPKPKANARNPKADNRRAA